MEFYLSFSDLLARVPNRIGVLFAPVFLFTILAEALVIRARAGRYPWRNTGVSMHAGDRAYDQPGSGARSDILGDRGGRLFGPADNHSGFVRVIGRRSWHCSC